MITGHLGVAGLLRSFSGAEFRTRAYIALALASLAPDVLDLSFALIGFCSPYGLYTHTLYSVALQAAVVGSAVFLISGSRTMGLLFASAVLLHLPADFITGRKLFLPGGELIGLRVYDNPALDFLVEVPLVVAGWLVVRRTTRPAMRASSGWVLAGLLATQFVFDVTADPRLRKPNACFRSTTTRF
ncbi:hypothetical protein BH09GEM1_BH09GEM1_43210 [soil metagenome]